MAQQRSWFGQIRDGLSGLIDNASAPMQQGAVRNAALASKDAQLAGRIDEILAGRLLADQATAAPTDKSPDAARLSRTSHPSSRPKEHPSHF